MGTALLAFQLGRMPCAPVDTLDTRTEPRENETMNKLNRLKMLEWQKEDCVKGIGFAKGKNPNISEEVVSAYDAGHAQGYRAALAAVAFHAPETFDSA